MLFGEGFKCNKELNLKANEKHQVMFFIMMLGETNKDTRKHSNRMRTARSLPYGGVGICRRGLCPGGSLSRGSLSCGVSVQGVAVQWGLCLGGLCPEGVSVQGGLCLEVVSLTETSLRTLIIKKHPVTFFIVFAPTHKTTKICEDQNIELHKTPLKHLRETRRLPFSLISESA